MSDIRILPEHLANQIAAGEVVERPASVVKELLENAADAGAENVLVRYDPASGTIRVVDDGCGMDADDLLLCLERHATSKISDASDLMRVSTMGFRGEAIPSIASVSRTTIVSRRAGEPLGNRVEVRFGRVSSVGEAGCQVGTTVEVRELFGNVPARKKFLRTKRTETAHVDEVVRNFALAWPDISLIYERGGREALRLSPAPVVTRYRRIFRTAELIPFDLREEGENGPVRVSGGILAPEFCDSGARLVMLVNSRPVRDRLFFRAVAEALRGFIPAGGRPGGVVSLEIAPVDVDVNVHPAKLEVRFRSPAAVMAVVSRAVAGATLAAQESSRQVLRPEPSGPYGGDARPEVEGIRDAGGAGARSSPVPFARPGGDYDKMVGRTSAPVAAGSGEEVAEPAAPVAEDAVPGGFEVVGQLFDTYILGQSGDEFVVIDQHAAQERLRFEELKKQYLGGGVASQRLMFPTSIELSPAGIAALEENMEFAGRLGLEIEPFGGSTFVVKAVPAMLKDSDPAEVVREVIARLPGADADSDLVDGMLARMACRSSIMAGRRLSLAEMEALVRQMAAAGIFSHCPHGRPVVKRISRRAVEEWFRRG